MSPELDGPEEFAGLEDSEIYSPKVIEHARNPRNMGEMPDADGFARMNGLCGDTMEIWIRVSNNAIVRSTFMTDGCGPSIASGSMVTEVARGKSVVEAQKISQNDVLAALGGLPEGNQHCALLAATTLKAAVKEYLAMQKDPWKKAYRRSG
jgi:nitrogen fixation protein NifU and related proteins